MSSIDVHRGPLTARVGAGTDVGRVRESNEDAYLAEDLVLLVADGLGGHAAGEVASVIAVATMRELAGRASRTAEDVARQVTVAGDRVVEAGRRNPAYAGMGTTLTGVVLVDAGGTARTGQGWSDGRPAEADGAEPPGSERGARWVVVNVGDSRTYRLDGGVLERLTTDHSEVQELVDAGLLTAEQAERHPLRNIVTRSLGQGLGVRPDVRVLEPRAGERLLVCSDGLTGELPEPEIRNLLLAHDDPQDAVDALVAAALRAGGRDNVTVVVADVLSVGDPPAPSRGRQPSP
ncbi:Protein phosphatase [Nostocoides japonicum T1-X7]|uniref:Protein phosphatase n=1 Tax=Nostocoides japonicum T1-X7 TaxID=1194083 RepID=A0A077M8Q9_9MICO|nr:serine/threonine-protein phosphatase [Tetrasphaera japonica]CCH80424.1 Protein phosphatase [Tetrasphaera japonica T1-X7]